MHLLKQAFLSDPCTIRCCVLIVHSYIVNTCYSVFVGVLHVFFYRFKLMCLVSWLIDWWNPDGHLALLTICLKVSLSSNNLSLVNRFTSYSQTMLLKSRPFHQHSVTLDSEHWMSYFYWSCPPFSQGFQWKMLRLLHDCRTLHNLRNLIM